MQSQLPGSVLAAASSSYISPSTVATGAAQTLAHGLGYTPTKLKVWVTVGSNGAGAAGVQCPAVAITITASSTLLTITAPAAFAGGSFACEAY